MRVMLGIVGFVLMVGSVSAASVGNVGGVVYDAATRSPLFGASVMVKGTEFGAAANADGRFVITGVPTGTYIVVATMLGYRSVAKTSIVVSPGRTTDLAFHLAEEAIMMSTTVVKPEHFPKVKDAPVSERSFVAEEIRSQTGGIGDIQRVVQSMPAVVSSGDQDNEVIVRGGNPNENLFLIDGIEFPFPNHFGSPLTQGGPINIFDAKLIREVDFVAGAFPARYGERASSVMDIGLKRGSDDDIEGMVDLGMVGVGVIAEAPLPGKGNSFLGSYHKSFLEIMTKMKVWGLGSVPVYDNALGKFSFRVGPGQDLFILGVWAADRIHQDGYSDSSLKSRQTDFESRRYTTGLGWQSLFGEKGYGKLALFGSSTKWDVLVYDTTVTGENTVYKNAAEEQRWGGRYDVALRLTEGHETQAGVKYSYEPFFFALYSRPDTLFSYRYNPDGTIRDSQPFIDRASGQPIIYSTDVQEDQSTYRASGYVQHRLPLSRLGHLTLGCRFDWFNYTREFDISPRCGLSTGELAAGFSLHAGYGWHFQSPSYYTLALDPVNNHLLRDRRSDHYVLGIERTIGDVTKLSLEGYYKKNQYIAIPASWTTPDPYDDGGIYLDIGEGRARGIELFLQRKFANNWQGTAAYSLSDSKIENPQDPALMIPGDFDYRNVLTFTGSYKVEFYRHAWYQNLPGWLRATVGGFFLSDEADIGVKFRYMGGTAYTPQQWIPETRQWITNGSLINARRYPDYYRVDVRWDHKFISRKWNMSWYLEIQNVTDRKNVWFYQYNDDGTVETYHQFRFFPVGGFVVEF